MNEIITERGIRDTYNFMHINNNNNNKRNNLLGSLIFI